MVLDKTGGLFRLAVGLMGAFSASTADFTPLVDIPATTITTTTTAWVTAL
jgi:hypothetical protein